MVFLHCLLLSSVPTESPFIANIAPARLAIVLHVSFAEKQELYVPAEPENSVAMSTPGFSVYTLATKYVLDEVTTLSIEMLSPVRLYSQ